MRPKMLPAPGRENEMAATTAARQRRKKVVSTDLAVAVVLDRSTSMTGLQHAVIEGFNEYLAELREQEGETFLTLTVFADEYEFVYEGKPLDEVVELTTETYSPYGNTALYDSIAATARRVEASLKAAGKPDTKVLIVTLTDGEENWSKEFDRNEDGAARLAKLVQKYEAKGNYTFVYLGYGQTRAYVASSAVRGMGYIGDNGYYAAATADSVSMSMSNLASGSASLRSSSKGSSANFMADAGVVMAGVADDVDVVVSPDPVVPAPKSGPSRSSLLDVLGGGK